MMGKLVTDGEETQKTLGSFHQSFKVFMESQRQRQMDIDDDKCLESLYRVDPQGQIVTIEGKKEKLFPAAYRWILDTKEYKSLTDWRSHDCSSPRVLWVNGPAGTGKTMLLLGIISQIYDRPSNSSPGISYFFCDAQEEENNAMDALRSMVWLLLIQQPHLLSYVTEDHKRKGSKMFNGSNAFFLLKKTFVQMLKDEKLSPVYLAWDALDECAPGKPGAKDLLEVISESLNITGKSAGKVKWIVSSRPEVEVNKRLGRNNGSVVELDVQNHVEPMNAYIAHKLSELQQDLLYKQEDIAGMEAEICKRAQNTYLWVALVFRDIFEDRLSPRQAMNKIKESPDDIFALYDRMMARIDQQKNEQDKGYCKDLLAAVCFASRPLSKEEAHVLAGLPSNVGIDEILRFCGSFLVVRDGTIYMLHNTTREHLRKYFASREDDIHFQMFSRSVAAMSKDLRYNMYSLSPGSESAHIEPMKHDALTSIKYSCEFWVAHLRERSEPLADNGAVLGFLDIHFLHWLESLSLMHKVPSVFPAINDLLSKAEVRLPGRERNGISTSKLNN